MTLVAVCSHQVNPWYSDTYVFPNDFPALLEDCPDPPTSAEHPLMKVAPAKGAWWGSTRTLGSLVCARTHTQMAVLVEDRNHNVLIVYITCVYKYCFRHLYTHTHTHTHNTIIVTLHMSLFPQSCNVFSSAFWCNSSGDASWRDMLRHWGVDEAAAGARPDLLVGANIWEQRGNHGMLQSPPTLPNMGIVFHAQWGSKICEFVGGDFPVHMVWQCPYSVTLLMQCDTVSTGC